jgi:outer membrane protein
MISSLPWELFYEPEKTLEMGEYRMKRLTLVLCLAAVALTLGPAKMLAGDEMKIGFVNAQRIIDESQAGKEAYQKLKDLQEQHRQAVEAKKAEIDKAEEELKKQYLTLSESARAEKEEALRKAKKEFKRMLEDADADMSAKEKQYLEKIDKEVMAIIHKIGKEEGFSLILGNAGPSILYANPALDLTDRIIKLYDQQKAQQK